MGEECQEEKLLPLPVAPKASGSAQNAAWSSHQALTSLATTWSEGEGWGGGGNGGESGVAASKALARLRARTGVGPCWPRWPW